MFSALTQGSIVYLLDKSSTPEYKTGEIIGVSAPRTGYNMLPTIDMRVKVDGAVQEFNNLPSINSVATYNNGKLIISETKQSILQEVEAMLESSRQIVENIDSYKENISICEQILRQLNPQFAKDKERDERLLNLESRFDGVESKLDKIFNLILK